MATSDNIYAEKDKASTSVVKNIAFVNYNDPVEHQGGGFINTNYGTIENVYISRSGKPWECGGVAGINNGTVKNVVLDCTGASYGKFLGFAAIENNGAIENVYVVRHTEGYSMTSPLIATNNAAEKTENSCLWRKSMQTEKISGS